MIKNIPAQIIVYCDVCGKDGSQTPFKCNGHIKIQTDTTIDLCDECLHELCMAIDGRIEYITQRNK